MLQIRLQCRVSLLRRRQVAGLQRLSERAEILLERAVGLGRLTASMAMVVAMPARGVLLGALLDGHKVLLRGREIARLQVLAERQKLLRQRAGRRVRPRHRVARRLAARQLLSQRGIVLLRLTEITGLQILPQLLKLAPNLLKLVLR